MKDFLSLPSPFSHLLREPTMAAASLSSLAHTIPRMPSPHSLSSSLTLHISFKSKNPIKIPQLERTLNPRRTAAAVRAEFDISIFERDLGGIGPGSPVSDEKEEPECPPGLRQYETTVILRPNMSEDERLAFIHKYEQLLIAGGGVHVAVSSRGVFPLSYGIRKRNKAGETNTYLDGIDLLFTYFTKPESISIVVETLLRDDDVVRSSSFKKRKRRLF